MEGLVGIPGSVGGAIAGECRGVWLFNKKFACLREDDEP